MCENCVKYADEILKNFPGTPDAMVALQESLTKISEKFSEANGWEKSLEDEVMPDALMMGIFLIGTILGMRKHTDGKFSFRGDFRSSHGRKQKIQTLNLDGGGYLKKLNV